MLNIEHYSKEFSVFDIPGFVGIILASIGSARCHMNKLGSISFSLFAFCFLFLGCTFNVNISEIGDNPKPLINPLPLNIAVYYRNDFRKFEAQKILSIEGSREEGSRLIFHLGKANIALFDYILHHVFKEVSHVKHPPENNVDMGKVDIILEPSITSYLCIFNHGWETECQVDITYTIKFYSKNGVAMGTWLIGAEGRGYAHFGTLGSIAKDATQNAMRDLAVQFLTGICKNMTAKGLFDKKCN